MSGYLERYGGDQPEAPPDLAVWTQPEETTAAPPTPTSGTPQSAIPLPWRPFPLRALPPVLADYAGGVAESIGCCPTFAALPGLSIVAACIGQSRELEVKPGWWEPSILWTAVLAESASGKTPAFKAMLRPLRMLEDERLQVHADECDRILMAHADENAGRKKQDRTEPELPPTPRLVASDATIEALACVLADNPDGILLAEDELSGWLKSFDAYKGGRGGDRAKWLQLYDAGRLTIDRKTGTRLTIVPRAAVSVTGGIQPGILRTSLSGEDYDSGLVARFLLASPPDRVMGWNEATMPHPGPYQQLLATLLDGRSEQRTIPLGPAARELLAGFKNVDVTRLRGISGPLRSAWGKSAGRAARLALLIHCVESPQAEAVSADAMQRALELVGWFDRETERVYAALGVCQSPEAELLAFIAQEGAVSARDVHRWKTSRFPTTAEAERRLLQLQAQDRLEVKTVSTGGRPKTVFSIAHPQTNDKSPVF